MGTSVVDKLSLISIFK